VTAHQSAGPSAVDAAESAVVTLVMRGMLHELANLATALDGVGNALKFDGADAVDRAQQDLTRTTDRVFALHGHLRSLLPDHTRAEPLDPRQIAAEVAALLAWHVERPCTITLEESTVEPILAEPWKVRRQLLTACDAAVDADGVLRFSLRVRDGSVEAVSTMGDVFWSAPTLAAARRLERAGNTAGNA
jgi:hypothetical protein